MSEQPKLSVLQRVLLTITREEDEEKLLEIYAFHAPSHLFSGTRTGNRSL